MLSVLLLFLRRRTIPVLAFGAGVGVPVLLWLAWALLTPRDFELQYLRLLFGRTGSGTLLDRIVAEGARYWSEFARVPAVLPLVAMAVYGYWRHRPWKRREVAVLLVLTAILTGLHAVVAGKESGYYSLYPTVLLVGVVAVGLGEVLFDGLVVRRRRLGSLLAMASVVLFLANAAMLSLVPRLLAAWKQGPERNYALQLEPLGRAVEAGDEVWGDPVTWIAVVGAGGKLRVGNWTQGVSPLAPDPTRQKYVVMARGKPFTGMENYRKVREFGADLPMVFGSSLSDRAYTFDLWQSRSMD